MMRWLPSHRLISAKSPLPQRLSSYKRALLAQLRSVVALKKDLVTLEEHYNTCSHHLAHGETVDFSKEPLGKNLWEVYNIYKSFLRLVLN
jgi:hypothetical protein